MTEGAEGGEQPDAEVPDAGGHDAGGHDAGGHDAGARNAGLSGSGGLLARAGRMEYDRILFFSDAVFAIAITLLVVDLPEQLEAGKGAVIQSGTVLRDSGGPILGFAISFAVIGLFWMSHHGLFRFVRAFDRPLMLLNLLFLGTIAFLPFPTALLSRTSSSQAPAVIFYAACVGTAGLLLWLTFLYASTSPAGLVTGISSRERRYALLSIARIPAVFAASIGIALVAPRVAEYFWLTIVVADVVIGRFHRGGGGAAALPDPADAALPPE
jgi:uncharacterized membrane protein